jgi:hypothetical protein
MCSYGIKLMAVRGPGTHFFFLWCESELLTIRKVGVIFASVCFRLLGHILFARLAGAHICCQKAGVADETLSNWGYGGKDESIYAV